MKRILLLFIVIMPLISCVEFRPEISENQSYGKDCELKTMKLDLKVGIAPPVTSMGDCDENCLIFPVIVSAGSLIVSGSMVLTNNALHWLEYQGKCNLSLDKFLTNSEGDEIEVITESCILECDLDTGHCRCIKENINP